MSAIRIAKPSAGADATVLVCGNWSAVYDSTGARLFEVPLDPLERGAKGSVAAALRSLGLDVDAKTIPVDPAFHDFPASL